jgi:hypothetical protein
MHTAVKLPLRSIDSAMVRDWQEKYPEAEMHIVTDDAPTATGALTENRFWEIISRLDWRKADDGDILAPAVQTLSGHTEEEIRDFSELLARKLYELDGERFARELAPEDAWPNKGFSADVFLYTRCCVVANGTEFFDQVLADPTLMPKGFTFEALLYLPHEAWKLKTGHDDYFQYTTYWYETFSNPTGWPGRTPLKDRVTGNHG